MPQIKVQLAERSYPIHLEHEGKDRLRKLVKKHANGARVFAIFDAQFFTLHGERVIEDLGVPAKRLEQLVVPPGEKTKSTSQLKKLHDFLLTSKISRSDFILGIGGGVTTDLVGFAAATALRGIRWGAVPTTLLGMVDAAIGGKTGINHKAGKNLVGAFWQPSFVYGDTAWLNTLERRHMIAGYGEILKYVGLVGEAMLKPMRRVIDGGDFYDQRLVLQLARNSARYKAEIVSRDEREGNDRMFLNYGHTFAHAIERSLGYGRLLHGEAVILGLLGALALGNFYHGRESRAISEYRELVEQCIPLVPRRRLDTDKIKDAMTLDKKRSGADLKYILLARPGEPFIATNVKRRLVDRALERMHEFYERDGGKDANRSGR